MALQTAEEYREALRFFEPILQVQKSADTPLFVNLAICFRETSQFDKAESCYLTAIDREENNLELLRDLAKMFSDASLEAQARSYLEKFLSVKREHIKRAMAQYDSPDISISSIEGDGQDPFHIPKLLLKPKSRRGGRRNESDTVVHEPLRDQFLEMEALTGRIQADDAEAKREWMSLAKDLFANFVNVRVFYPDRRYERFFGFSREARMKAIRMRPEDVNNDLFQGT